MTESQTKSVPFEVQASFVDSLYRGSASLISGAILQAVAVIGSWLESGQDIFLYLVLAILAVGVWRYLEGRAYHAQESPVSTPDDARYWELKYLYSTVMAAVLIGAYAFLGIYLYPSEYSSLASSIIAAGSMASIVGRIYGSSRIVTAMVVSVSVPLSLALLMRGDIAHLALAVLAMPFFLLVRSNAARVREHLFEATERRTLAQALAERFDLALNNMTHGLFMLDDRQCIEVANDKALSLLGLAPPVNLVGKNFLSLMRYSAAKGLVEKSDLPKLTALLKRMETSNIDRKTYVRFSNGIYIEFSLRPRSGGGGVLIFEDVTERVRSEKKIQHMARFDMLTGLANRAEISTVASTMLGQTAKGASAAVFLLDVNDFKHVNDTYGHPTGDAILRQIASRLTALETGNMRASRLGGDEFLLIGNGFETAEAAGTFAQKLSDRLCGIYEHEESLFQISVSVGYVTGIDRNETMDSLLVKADLALYAVKADPGRSFAAYEPSMKEQYTHRQRMKVALRQAIADQSLNVIYQPILSNRSMRLSACEALARWHHPELGHVPPVQFIPLAEEMGLISEISRFMLNRACCDCMSWNPNMSVSVNLSAYDFEHDDVIEMVSAALRLSGLPPHRLELEVTESIVLDDKRDARATLEKLKAKGVKIALDDFGTGYSNLSYLHELPLDRIKIDRTFVMTVMENDRALKLLRGVANLAREVGLYITLEGVETIEQLELISQSVDLDRLQGYLFGASYSSELVRELGGTVWGLDARSWSTNTNSVVALSS